MPLPPKRSHKISLDKAAAMTKRQSDARKGGFFFREELDAILAQPGCAGVRIYFGRGDDGGANLVITGVDGDGKDQTQGTVMEDFLPCPPWCDDSSALKS